MSNATKDLAANGVSVWLDDLSRELLESGDLQKLIDERGVVGVTTNPTIFANALSKGDRYQDQVDALAKKNADVDLAVFEITTDDVRSACDVFKPLFDNTKGQDGRVSIEVDPRLARDTAGTIDSAKKLWATVDRANAMIKIPASVEGLPAITAVIGEGISVNVTLIFSLERYRAVIDAYLAGLEQAKAKGIDLSTIRSVASFFVSRVDTEIDKRLTAIGSDEALALKSKAGLANAQLAYQAFEESIATARWSELAAAGANVQRPLWASTGVKDPKLPDTLYVTELVAKDTVNTMPGATLEATFDHGVITGDTVTGSYAAATATMDALANAGVDYNDVVNLLEVEGLDKFEKSWGELLGSITDELERAKARVSE
ncbi:transaldolase [Kineosporia sp. NBRC 101731]|uniref:transaldolase n=1 Tax=Kineosporia sp. NBRC 101731 TaxID=3032199 RepID=UPI0024A413C7|nr:transaldolase [Kineosporia sp. NBRC 101731]GLY28733.1 transaldolase [Kineosporia sp. NBRC 101731]